MPSNLASSSFQLFPLLPVELQDEIWSWAAATSISSSLLAPEVCIANHQLILRRQEGEGNQPLEKDNIPSLPLTVDTAWPPIAHTCRNSRAVLFFRTPGFTLRSHHTISSSGPPFDNVNDQGGIVTQVPYRFFDPAIDTLFWTSRESFAMTTHFLRDPANKSLAMGLRHIAVELGATFPPSELAELLRVHAINVRSLTVVVNLPPTTTRMSFAAGETGQDKGTIVVDFSSKTVTPTIRSRCKLRRLSRDEQKRIVLRELPFRMPPQRLEEFLGETKREIEKHVVDFSARSRHNRLAAVVGDAGLTTVMPADADNSRWRRLDGFEITAGVFE